jgi:predicted phosphoribosyltransferase
MYVLESASFVDRQDAGRQLARQLVDYRGKDAIVCPLVRGGVILAAEIADFLQLPIEPIFIRKVGHPGNPEFAIGAVSDEGHRVTASYARNVVNALWLENQVAIRREEAASGRRRYLGDRPLHSLTGKIAIIVDDGVATGLSLNLAITIVRNRRPKELIVALPVIDLDTLGRLDSRVDKIAAINTPSYPVGAVSLNYAHFSEVSDDEIVRILAQHP